MKNNNYLYYSKYRKYKSLYKQFAGTTKTIYINSPDGGKIQLEIELPILISDLKKN